MIRLHRFLSKPPVPGSAGGGTRPFAVLRSVSGECGHLVGVRGPQSVYAHRSDAAGNLRQWLLAAAAGLQKEVWLGGLWLGWMVRSVTEVNVA